MIISNSTLKDFEFILVGSINSTLIYNLINDLNTIQKEFRFDFNDKVIELPESFKRKKINLSDDLEKHLKRRTANYKPLSFKIFICDLKLEDDLY